MANHYGLVGYPLGHSFSKKYFEDKFKVSNASDTYNLFEISSAKQAVDVIKTNNLKGLNVTIPHKQNVIPLLNELDRSAKLVGAVNVIKNDNGVLIGFNTDYPAFRLSLKKWLEHTRLKALVLGTGGASKAVVAALNDLKIQHQLVSRTDASNTITYTEATNNPDWLKRYKLIINTSPVGTAPNTEESPSLPYNLLSQDHYLFDLVYNPEETAFMRKGLAYGAKVKNGIEMLHLQAELAWDIWNA